jgi:ribA/ribD-fused uncharacterized protein
MKEAGIHGFFNEYRFLSNFWPCTIEYEGLKFNNSESLYMAHKSGNVEDFTKFAGITKPGDAKRLGRTVKLRSDWDQVKFAIMEDVLRLKFGQNPDLRAKLLATNEVELIESNSWHDNIWGSCICSQCGNKGKNNLGKILMKLRQDYF